MALIAVAAIALLAKGGNAMATEKANASASESEAEAEASAEYAGTTFDGVEVYRADNAFVYLSHFAVCTDGAPGNPYNDPDWQPTIATGAINADRVNYIVISEAGQTVMGLPRHPNLALSYVVNLDSGIGAGALYAETGGSKNRLGEGSICLGRRIGIPNISPRNGLDSKSIAWVVFPNSGKGRVYDGYESDAERLYQDWGGLDRVRKTLGI